MLTLYFGRSGARNKAFNHCFFNAGKTGDIDNQSFSDNLLIVTY